MAKLENNKKIKGCFKKYHYCHAKEYVDYDYIEKLTDEEAEWLAKFSDNYYGARFKADESQNIDKNRSDAYRRSKERRRDFCSGQYKSRTELDDKQLDTMFPTERGIWKK
jgi:hypothetical protein